MQNLSLEETQNLIQKIVKPKLNLPAKQDNINGEIHGALLEI